MFAAGERVQARVGRNAVEPGAKRSAPVEAVELEAVEAPPRAQIGLLNGVLGFVQGAKHAVTMQVELAAERFGEQFRRLARSLQGWLLMRSFRPCHGNHYAASG